MNAINQALNAANAAYIARNGATANLNKSGINPDIARAMSIAARITQPQRDAIKALEIDSQMIKGLTDATNTKKPMRTLEALLFSITGDGQYLKGSARTFLLEFCGLVLATPKTRAGLAFCATGRGNESSSDEVKIAQARKIMGAFGKVSLTSEPTQNSVAFSSGGIAATLGVAHKDKRNGMPVIDLTNKVAQSLDAMVRKMTDSKLALIVEQSKARAK